MKLILLGTAVLTSIASVPTLVMSEIGDIQVFSMDGVDDQFVFAYIENDQSTLACLLGSVETGFRVIGRSDVFGPNIKFIDANIDVDTGVVTELSTADFVLSSAGDESDLTLPLVKTLALMAKAGLADMRYKVDLIMGDGVMFSVNPKGNTDLPLFVLGNSVFGAYANSDQMLVVAVDQTDANEQFLPALIIGTIPMSLLATSVVHVASEDILAQQMAAGDGLDGMSPTQMGVEYVD
jgi:hypothetical protein